MAANFLLWYGYIYYIIAFLGVFIFTSYISKLFYKVSINYIKITKDFIFFIISFFLFLSLLVFTAQFSSTIMYSTFVYSSFVEMTTTNYCYTNYYFSYFDTTVSNYLLNLEYTNLTLMSVYSFPFIYIFIFITMLSLFFCLAYNTNELSIFSFYVLIILTAGYLLFFTDSLVLFFFSYEALLVPSFFILYNFAKTRRCVEAAYLMFF